MNCPLRKFGLLFIAVLSGCTQIKVEGTQPSVKYYWGIPHVKLSDDSPVNYSKVTSIGVGSTSKGMNIGYSEVEQIAVNDSSICSVIIIVKDEKQIENIKKDLAVSGQDLNRICIYPK